MSTLSPRSCWMLEQAKKLPRRHRHVWYLVDSKSQKGICCTVGKSHQRQQQGMWGRRGNKVCNTSSDVRAFVLSASYCNTVRSPKWLHRSILESAMKSISAVVEAKRRFHVGEIDKVRAIFRCRATKIADEYRPRFHFMVEDL